MTVVLEMNHAFESNPFAFSASPFIKASDTSCKLAIFLSPF
jgi:hypothetical protein